MEVEAKSLRVLESQFTRIMDGSFKCHLCGILPPGGGDKWPGSTKDYLESLLKVNSDFYIEKVVSIVRLNFTFTVLEVCKRLLGNFLRNK